MSESNIDTGEHIVIRPESDQFFPAADWSAHAVQLRASLIEEGYTPDEADAGLREAFGGITFADEQAARWRHDGRQWWLWAGTAWQTGTPSHLKFDELSFDVDNSELVPDSLFAVPPEDFDFDADLDDDFEVGSASVETPVVAGFRPTHRAPGTGLQTWPEAGAAQPGPMLEPKLLVEVVRVWGEWAQIRCSNGWTAWVDHRALVATAPLPPPGAAR